MDGRRVVGRLAASSLVVAAVAAVVGCAGSHGAGFSPAGSPALRSVAGPGGASAPAARDLGRRAARKPVSIVVQLRYNRQAELDRLVEQLADPHSGRFHHFLTRAQFDAKFAPTAAQEASAVAALRAAGFAIDHRYANRALIDAHAPSTVVERYFSTQIHDFAQARYGTRFASVRPVVLPATIARTVASVDIDTVVHMHVGVQALPPLVVPDAARQPDAAPQPDAAAVIQNGGFETGKLAPWTACASTKKQPAATVSKLHPYAGRFDALTGTQTSGEPNGIDGLCQTVTIPKTAPQLAAFLYDITNEKKVKQGAQVVALFTVKGAPIATLLSTKQNKAAWVAQTWNLAPYAGRKVIVFFGVQGGNESNLSIQQFVDNVSLVSVTPSPSPTPLPGTPAPTPTPGGTLPSGPGAPIAGPTYGPDGGWGPLAVANGFDFPVQHGYNGSGETAAVVIDCEVPSDAISAYLTNYQIAETGSVSNESIDGGPASSTVCANDGLEATLDVETIAGLAPGANVIVYAIPSLDNQKIEDAYNQVVTDHKAIAVNSSFGGCEAQDTSFDSQSDATAVEGAALGITFSASSGDQGSACYKGNFVFGVNAPASDPHFVGVGGNESDPTDFAGDDGINTPQAWNDCPYSACATGGGISTVWPLPAYQTGVAGSPASTTHRNVPDIAFPAVGDEIFVDNGSGPVPEDIVGTSWASPIDVALLTEIAQICHGAGFANQTFYSLYGDNGESPLFIDVTTGNNAYNNPPTSPTTPYNAATGYDNTTGIGMPSGFDFSAAMCGKTPSARHRPLSH